VVTIERLAEEHLESTRRWLTASARLREQIDCLAAPSAAENEAYWRRKWADASREDYAILDEGAIHVGNCGLSDIDLQRGKTQLWIYLAEREGRGVGRRAVRLLLGRAFEELELERVYLRVLITNPRAYAFYLRLGFVEEGRLRRDTVSGDTFVDAVLLSMLSDEFKARQMVG
jgi:RimJ/RimL family protein N-acetyltransferase